MKATDLLRRQHDQVEDMLRRLESLEGDERTALCGELARALRGHNTIEEELFYPRLQDRDDLAELVSDSFEEHEQTNAVLGDLERADAASDAFGEKLAELTQLVMAHVTKEEEQLLPKVESLWTNEMLDEAGREMRQRFDELEKGEEARV